VININEVRRGVIQEMFPTGLYAMRDLLSAEENEILVRKILQLEGIFGRGNLNDWLSGQSSPSNCFHLSSLKDYLEFQPLIDRTTQCVEEFARAYGSDAEYFCNDAWYNVYTPGQYQEFHTHPNSIFSCVYFVSVPENAPGIYFKRPNSDCMYPPKDISRVTPLQDRHVTAPAVECALVIFRSDLQHSVPPGSFDGKRITIAMNFD
tara:strand:+ start:66 stop:683 length:618 start_codon:yes stop_codon:yes gene_type:complete